MIFYVASEAHTYTMTFFLKYWAPRLAPRVEVVAYDTLFDDTAFPAGTYVFADLERLTPEETARAGEVCKELRRVGFPVMNDPGKTLGRYDLVRTLFEKGESPFTIYRLSDTRSPRQFPVFLRSEREHMVLGRLARTQRELNRTVEDVQKIGYTIDDLLMVEFYDTRDSTGVFRCYSAFFVAGRVIPRSLFFKRGWKVKSPGLLKEKHIKEERSYLAMNPHEEWIRQIFREARADYGKIDYGVSDGKPVMWEINTNPMILWPSTDYTEEQLPSQLLFAEALTHAFQAIDFSPAPGSGFSVALPR